MNAPASCPLPRPRQRRPGQGRRPGRLPAGLCRAALLAPALLVLPLRAQELPAPHGAAADSIACPGPQPGAGGPAAGQRFLMAAFPATSQTSLSLFSSRDGITYTTLASEVWQPPQGLLRDPSIMRADDGSYLIVYTTGWSGRSFGVARSRDLRQWQHVADITLSLPGLTNVWAPEWFRDADGRLSVIVSLSTGGTGGPFRAYHLQPSATDFSAFGPPRPLQGLDRNPIDTVVVREGGRYVAFTKNESTKFIERAWAPALDGPWTYDRTGDWAGWGGPLEGPALVRVCDAQGRAGWRLHLEDYTRKHYRYADSFDGLDTWTPLRELQGVSGAVRHFSVLAEDGEALQRATAPRSRPRSLAWDRHSLIIDGRREMIWSGEFHPFRLPSPSLWRDVLQKMKAIGFNAVSIYFSWGYHSAQPGQYDFSGVRNVERVLDMAAEEGLYVIARPGPYVNAELAGGGFPGWLQRQGAEARTDAPEYQQAAAGWLSQVNAIIARHQLPTGGGTVIAYQLENELSSVQPKQARHMQFLADKARADGIRVPLFHNAAARLPDWTPRDSSAPFANPGPTDLYAFDGYPGGACTAAGEPAAPSPAQDWGLHGKHLPRVGALASPRTPGFVAEIGGGWFDHWGSNGSYECTAQRQGTGYQRVAYGSNLVNGLTIHNIYMAFGGTSWGWQPAPVVFSSYDYGAAIDEARRLRPKALGLKQLGHFVQAATPVLAELDAGPPLVASNPRVRLVHSVNAALKTHLVLARREPAANTGREAFAFTMDTADGRYHIPQAGTLQLAGEDAKLLLARHALARQHLVYSTSELQAQLAQGERDLVLLHGRHGEDGETVLRFARRPRVQVLAGPDDAALQQHWDATRGDLRLNYRHQGLLELLIDDGGHAPLLLLLADEPHAQAFWRLDTGEGAVLAASPALLRSARREGDTLVLQGDTAADSPLRVWPAPGLAQLRFNGQALAVQPAPGGSLRTLAPLPGPLAVTVPDLQQLPWQTRADSPEAAPGFDDSRWRHAAPGPSAAHVYTAPPPGQPVLAMSDHGFHRGDVWYRGRFRSGPGSSALQLELFFGAGTAGLAQAWLDGRFIGQHETDAGRPFGQTTASLKTVLKDLPEGEHLLAVMVRNMGHNWDLFADDAHKEARGLIAASLAPRGGRRHAVPIDWRVQGNLGGEEIADLLRGPYNNGGLYGERQGWHLPAPPGAAPQPGWQPGSVQAAPPAPGTYWLRTRFTLALPEDHDVQLGLAFGDPGVPRSLAEHRVLIFLNGWLMGQYISHIGPQRVFVLPPGLLHPRGENTLALAVTTDGDARNALESVKLLALQVQRGGVPLALVPAASQLQRPAP